MYCPKCGTENTEAVQSCQSCGAILEWSESQATAEPPKTSRLAIAALVLGILSFFTCFITAIPAVITGIMSLVKISKSQGKQKGLGFAITGVVLSTLVMPAFMLLAILMPALGKVNELAYRLTCGNNMKGISVAIDVYSFDYDDKYPTGSQWCDLLIEHADVGEKSLVCRGSDQGQSNYALNANALRLGKDAPSDMVLMFECATGWNQVGGPELLTTENHKGEGCNILFVDGHVEFIKTENLNNLRWTLDEFEVQHHDY